MNWIDTSEMDFHEEFVGESFGRINKQEANLLLQELEAYINRIGKARILDEKIDFGLISPYKAQVQYLRSKIKVSSFLRPFRSLITVNTVDGFQGQERDVIFISLVRANEDGQIGFLNDLRRMNVAITRARMKLVILGDAVTLTKHPFYKRLMSFKKKRIMSNPLFIKSPFLTRKNFLTQTKQTMFSVLYTLFIFRHIRLKSWN